MRCRQQRGLATCRTLVEIMDGVMNGMIAVRRQCRYWVLGWAHRAPGELSSAGYGPALAMAAGTGVLAGFFFGTWSGFVWHTNRFDSLDRDPHTQRHAGPTDIAQRSGDS